MDDELPDFRTRASLGDNLNRIGLRAGDTVMVNAAMSKVGPLLNGPDALSNAILDVVGAEGSVLVYTSWDSRHDDLMDDDGRVLPEWRDHVPGFDRQASRAVRAGSHGRSALGHHDARPPCRPPCHFAG